MREIRPESLYKKVQEVDKCINDLCFGIVERMAELGEIEVDLSNVEYDRKFSEKRGKVVSTYVKKVSLEKGLNLYNMGLIESVLGQYIEFKLSNCKEICADDLPVNKAAFLLVEIIEQLDHMLECKGKPFHSKCEFNNRTIVITDPCYIIKKQEDVVEKEKMEFIDWQKMDPAVKNSWSKPFTLEQFAEFFRCHREWNKLKNQYLKNNCRSDDDWEKCEFGDNMEKLGIYNYICSGTLYGDWSCHVFRKEDNEVLGEFCADAGKVAVFALDEILAYNPEFKKTLEEKPFLAAVIPDFTGTVSFSVDEVDDSYEDEKGNDVEYKEYYLHVVGEGNVNFVTKQTGL